MLSRKKFIEKHKDWFWYTPKDKLHLISEELLMENVINYGSMDDIKEYIKIAGIEKVQITFKKFKGRRKNNIYPELYNLFKHYLNKISEQKNTE